jgi:hypothetical protein
MKSVEGEMGVPEFANSLTVPLCGLAAHTLPSPSIANV